MRLIKEALRKRKKTVNVAIVGCGWWGCGVAKYLYKMDFMHPRVLVDKEIDKCIQTYLDVGVYKNQILRIENAKDINKANEYRHIVISDLSLFGELLPKLNVDVIHEAIGEVLPGAQVAMMAMENKLPFTTINSEMDATIGLILSQKAEQKGIVYTNSDGDQPGCLARMLDYIIGWGFEPRIIGNNKLFLDYYQTPEGVMPWVPKGGNPYVLSSAADGSKLALELSVVANAFNYPPLKRGMYGPEAKKSDLISVFDRLVNLNSLDGGHIDYTLGTTEPNMGGPVFVVAYTQDSRLQAEMKHYKKGPGPYYLFFRDHHIGSIEAPSTIAEASLFGSASLCPTVWCSDVITLAKRDLKAGKRLDLMGGYDYYGLAEKADIAISEKILPIGLAEFATLTCDVKKDAVITYDMVELEDNLATQLRKEQDALIQ
ncbi:MAG: hypothetical protein A3G33_04950 [Omnitrophica bacterium RIFCSPLOWO2_12_FULL_44_17]|uniref:Oxidoreductase DRL-like catalytic domain-containing protein n=1 Tax=Candidatus Danuiimicrobium aquiferis TaxID=1801832 RepID=A0A1G1KXL6_9BACT|nr:MAG: hypothetical protein A3B72_02375 [Omnitrophica bacterium RIFCSPHIGHO2_02_FULL_45_28]OGW89188.1 MAG: hypothetical protein A3E74_07890 [Omnitrophica bacterium RIFCSPHIGHO2_12_FULL_44_12]OGW97641.1 MAG: hypothetical protein A3G33_04950 [Omnitrophica bacterium RIFCSPLOWO2_12_FULL_44_17]OGX04637.1 MAG: hypothetical protein A3J12_09190 [Omnitrophica bacterium RIFCSPLOWO2_02_FULL_44_11]